MINTALKILNSGRSIIPLKKDKKPLIASWVDFQKRMPTKQEVEKWWAKWPDANIGIITGKVSNLCVIDIDVRHGGDINKFPQNTLTVKTGNGGYHLYYFYHEGMGNKVGAFEGVDIRGDGGYVVSPGSITDYENNGKREGGKYEIYKMADIADFPAHLFGLEEDSKLSRVEETTEGVSEGSRNESAAVMSGAFLRSFPRAKETAWKLLRSWNEKNIPPLSEYELRNTFNSIVKRGNYTGGELSVVETEPMKFLTYTEVLDMGMKELMETKKEEIISFGYDWLDDKLTGFFPGELVVIGGESGTGKTVFATNIIYRASRKVKCCVFALEDRLADYGIKSMFFEINRIKKEKDGIGYPWNDYRRNEILDVKFEEYKEQAFENLKNENIHFADVQRQMDIEILERKVTEKVAEGFKVFLIDHLHYFDLLAGRESKADYIEKMMVRIKALQNKTGARIILVVHYKKLEGRKPSMDSFKDSVSIPQNANYVINLWRDRSEGANHYDTIIMVPKSRNPNGEFTVKVTFDPSTNDYREVESKFGTERSEDNYSKIYEN